MEYHLLGKIFLTIGILPSINNPPMDRAAAYTSSVIPPCSTTDTISIKPLVSMNIRLITWNTDRSKIDPNTSNIKTNIVYGMIDRADNYIIPVSHRSNG